MNIVNEQVRRDLQEGKLLKLELGAGGKTSREGYYAVDLVPLAGVDIVANLNHPFDELPDNSVQEIYTRHTLEHVENLIGLLREIHRVTKPGGEITIIVPHFSNVYAFSDPTHVRFFGLYTMNYFMASEDQPGRKVPAFYTELRFKQKSVRIEFYQMTFVDRLVGGLFTRLFNRRISLQEFYERRLSSLYHAWQIRYILSPVK
jgi:hypothetical protein